MLVRVHVAADVVMGLERQRNVALLAMGMVPVLVIGIRPRMGPDPCEIAGRAGLKVLQGIDGLAGIRPMAIVEDGAAIAIEDMPVRSGPQREVVRMEIGRILFEFVGKILTNERVFGLVVMRHP